MKKKMEQLPVFPRSLVALIVVAAGLLWTASPALADLGPKPEMSFSLDYQVAAGDIAEAQMLECEDAFCATSEPLMEVGPQRFQCTNDSCYSMAYGYAPYHQLVITFMDGNTRKSDVFQKHAFDAHYVVSVTETGLDVVEVASQPGLLRFLGAGLLTLIIELGLAFAYLLIFRLPKRVLVWVLVANIISLPVVWFVFPVLPLSIALVIGLAELFAFLFEAGFLYLTNRRTLGIGHALGISLVTNASSFLLGLIIFSI